MQSRNPMTPPLLPRQERCSDRSVPPLGKTADLNAYLPCRGNNKVVAASMEAARKGDWEGYAGLVHSESLRDYKSMWLPVLQAAAKGAPAKQADLLALFDKATDLKSVLALKPKEFFVSSMKGMAAQTTMPKPVTAKTDEKILGTVREGNNLAHVLIRTRAKYQQTEVNKVDVVTLKRSDTEWRIILPEAVRIMAKAFRFGLL